MKKILKIVIIMLIGLSLPVQAANYELKELIPSGVKTTIVTNNFSYRNFSQVDNKLYFESIKNISDEERPITITVALFDKNKKNIGTVFYCNEKEKLASKTERKFEIILDNYIIKKKKAQDIKYIAVLNENPNCNIENNDVFAGQKLEDIGVIKKNPMTDSVVTLIKVFIGIAVVLIILFVYRLLFTTDYENFDGNDIRRGYKKYNKELAEERELERKKNPPKPKEVVKTKSDEVIRQEELEKRRKKEDSDLHKFYK